MPGRVALLLGLLLAAACTARSGPPMGADCYHPQGPYAPPVCSSGRG